MFQCPRDYDYCTCSYRHTYRYYHVLYMITTTITLSAVIIVNARNCTEYNETNNNICSCGITRLNDIIVLEDFA